MRRHSWWKPLALGWWARRRPTRCVRLTMETLEDRATPAATLLDVNPGALGSDPSAPVNVNGTVYFTADDGVHGRELWKSNGSAAGTTMVKDIVPGPSSSFSFGLTAVGT